MEVVCSCGTSPHLHSVISRAVFQNFRKGLRESGKIFSQNNQWWAEDVTRNSLYRTYCSCPTAVFTLPRTPSDDFSPRKPVFHSKAIRVGFVVDKLTLGQFFFLRVLRFCPVSNIPPILHTHLHPPPSMLCSVRNCCHMVLQ